MFADSIAVWPIGAGQGLIHNGGGSGAVIVQFGERAASQQRNSEQVKIVWSDSKNIDDGSLIGFHRDIFADEPEGIEVNCFVRQGNRTHVAQSNLLNSGQQSATTKNLANQCRFLGRSSVGISIGIVRHRQPQANSRYVLRLEPGRYVQ